MYTRVFVHDRGRVIYIHFGKARSHLVGWVGGMNIPRICLDVGMAMDPLNH